MDIDVARPTARIYQFPVRAMRRPREDVRPETTFDAPEAPAIYESGWYHGEAIADERRNAKK